MIKDPFDIDFGDDEPVREAAVDLSAEPTKKKESKPMLLIVRHGNTFEPGEPPRRIGARTDLPLTSEGRAQIAQLRNVLEKMNMMPKRIYSGPLQRTAQTAAILSPSYEVLEFLREIYHGMDENKTEDVVLKNVGRTAMEAWERDGKLPPGWTADILGIRQGWAGLRKLCKDNGETWCAVTSNGIARFAFDGVENAPADKKLSCGAFGVLVYTDGKWICQGWNLKP